MTVEDSMRRHPAWVPESREVVQARQDEEALDLANSHESPSLWDDVLFGLQVASMIAGAALVITVIVLYALTGVAS